MATLVGKGVRTLWNQAPRKYYNPPGVPGEGVVREFGMDRYTLLYLKWITIKDLPYSTWNSAQCCVAAWMGGSLGENGYMYMYGWVPSLYSWNYHDIVSRLCACMLSRFSRVWLCDLMDCSPPGSSVHGNSPARILEWAAVFFTFPV